MRLNLWGAPLDGMHPSALQHYIERAIKGAADALQHNDPMGARMYQEELAQLLAEKAQPGAYQSRYSGKR